MLVLALALSLGAAQERGRLGRFEEPFRDRDRRERREEEDAFLQEAQSRREAQESYFSPSGEERPAPALEALGTALLYPVLDHGLRFDAFPYATGRGGYFLGRAQSDRELAVEFRPYWLRVEHDLSAFGLMGAARVGSGSDLRFDILQYAESVDGHRERLTIQEYQLNYGPGEGPRDYHWTLGWGVASLSGEETHTGFSMQGALEWFPARPLSFRAQAAFIVFSRAQMADVQAEARLHLHRWALTLGVRSVRNSEGDHLTAPLVGVTVWF